MPRQQLFGIEINAVMHCNLACAGCSHASPVSSTWLADPETVLRDLSSLHAVADVGEVRVVGGEPLLHPDLPEVMAAIVSSKIGGVLRVITNGTRLQRAGWAWLQYADEVYVSVYPGTVVDPDALADLQRLGEQTSTRVAVNHFQHFRPTIPVRALSVEDTAAVFETCQVAHAWSCHTVQEGYVYLCPMTVPQPRDTAESVSRCPIEPLETLDRRLRAFLEPARPLPECRACLGTVGRLVPHRQVNKKSWAQMSTSDIDWAHVDRVRADPWVDSGCVADQVPAGP